MSNWTPNFELRHIGINHDDAQAANTCAQTLCGLFDLAEKEMPKSFFAGDLFELMKFNGQGRLGHIALAVDSVEQARAYLSEKGQTFQEDTAKYDAEGNLTFLYLEGDFSGFAIHLVLK